MTVKKEYIIVFFVLVLFFMYYLSTKDNTRKVETWEPSIELKPNKDGEAIKARIKEINKEVDENLRIYEERNGPGRCSTCGSTRSLRSKTCVYCGAP